MKTIQALVQLNERIRNDEYLKEVAKRVSQSNPWFVPEFIDTALSAICSEMLVRQKLEHWLGHYKIRPIQKTVGIIFAGNLPLVGFHDFLCAYVTGVQIQVKLSSKDDLLFKHLIDMLSEIDTDLLSRIEFVERLNGFDAVIATGSDNSYRYFEYYFRNVPTILRKNRNAVAVITGEESDEELRNLADDIFMYFGFGCRNVSKVFFPSGYDVTRIFPLMDKYKWLHQHSKYMNNYDYQRTLLLLNKTPHFANEFLMLVESGSIPSPISTLHYEFWDNEGNLLNGLAAHATEIQCIVSSSPKKFEAIGLSSVKFGASQHPELWQYADGVDTLDFLLSL